ncbi:MAG: hypothetical protein CVT92_14890 [Bacteroidetes bacterium HGW-Bacteroidetes-1]|jgi:acylphosphatase|nr:MAG: hypothetical protein CVT92_14890 [Bacteroidetes bacterium HGW-Bacteroidetes-1]
MIKAVIIQIFGRVQGVGFRYYTVHKAMELGVYGFVQNKGDGSVYIEAEPILQLSGHKIIIFCYFIFFC